VVFCSVELAARIEAAERDLVASACERIRDRCADPFLTGFGGGFVACTEPGSPMNKAVGFGFAPFDTAAWPAIEAEHDRRGAPLQVELSTLADPAVARYLTGRGYQLVGVENVSGRALAAADAGVSAPAPGTEVVRCGADQIESWLDVVVRGFAAPDREGVPSHEAIEQFDRDALARILRDFAAADGVRMFAAQRAGEMAGAGSMRIAGGIAQLCGAATLPAHRRRGVQTALLGHRLAHAAGAGCEFAVVTTQPGSKSQQNMQRAGFALLYARNVLLREPAAR
jgi:ribosomal protein S18 acetylase RimI-like enzyme